jgi:hypothetical protein
MDAVRLGHLRSLLLAAQKTRVRLGT